MNLHCLLAMRPGHVLGGVNKCACWDPQSHIQRQHVTRGKPSRCLLILLWRHYWQMSCTRCLNLGDSCQSHTGSSSSAVMQGPLTATCVLVRVHSTLKVLRTHEFWNVTLACKFQTQRWAPPSRD